ncbi:MAG: potassium transporter TrkG, partial [Bacteroidota bacterium]
DLFLYLIGKRKNFTLTSKIIIIITLLLWLGGAFQLFVSDQLWAMGWDGFQIALFQSMTAHTTVGFNSFDIGSFSTSALFVLIILMMIGASPSGTGGGIKTTSVTAVMAVLISVLRKRKIITFLNRAIPANNIYLAVSSTLFYSILLSLSTWGILLVDGELFSFQELLFECASALSTVGISTGITGDLSIGGKLIIIILMFVGRIGVLTFGFALISNAPLLKQTTIEEDIAI